MCVRNEVEIQRVGVLEIVESLWQFCLCSAVGLTDKRTNMVSTRYVCDSLIANSLNL